MSLADRRVAPFLLIGLLPVLLLAPGCSGSPPSIDELQWRVVYRDNGEDRFEQLMVFLRLADPDDIRDPDMITISVGDSGLLWRFPREQWGADPRGGDWVALPPMIAQTGSRLPGGIYTLRLEDLSGKADELEFRPDPDRPDLDELTWPEASLESGMLRLSGPSDGALLILRDAEGLSRESVPVNNGSPVDVGSAESWELWIPDEIHSGGFLLGPYPTVGD